MAPPITASLALRFGVRFHPTDEEAIALYLHRWVLGQPPLDTAGIVHHAQVYSCEPKHLAAAFPRLPKTHDRFFFTSVKRQKAGAGHRMVRAAGAGSWVSQTKKAVKNQAGEAIGFCESLHYTYKKEGGGGSGWLMEEYHCFLPEAVVDGGAAERVFCRIYISPRSLPGSVTHQESAAGDHRRQEQQPRQQPLPPVAVLPVIAQPQALKRPAPPCPVAQQESAAGDHRRQEQQPRQQPLPPVVVLPVIAQPQAPKRPAPPCPVAQPGRMTTASAPPLPRASEPRQRRVMATPVPAPVATQTQAPKRPAPPVAEPPCPKRMRGGAVLTRPVVQPASAPAAPLPCAPPPPTPSVPLPARRGMASRSVPLPAWFPPEHPGLLAAFETRRPHLSVLTSPPGAQWTVARPAPRCSPVAAPPRPMEAPAVAEDDDGFANFLEGFMEEAEDEAPIKDKEKDGIDMDEFASLLEADLDMAEEGQQKPAEAEADNDMDEFASLFEAELDTAEEGQQKPAAAESGNDMDEFASSLENVLDMAEEQGMIQEDDDMGEHASSLEGLMLDEREDDVIVQDAIDALKDIGDDPIIREGNDDWLTLPLSYYDDKFIY